MKKAKYLIEKENEDELILCNTFFGSVVSLNEEYKEYYKRLLNGDSIGIEGIKDAFLEQKLIFNSDEEENEEINKILLLQGSKSLNLTILPTTACNMKCEYCFENLRPYSAKIEIGNKICKWVEELYKEHKFEKIFVTWFGGEPLLNLEFIKNISNNLIKWCEHNTIDYDADIITNGTLLTRKVAETLVEKCKIKKCQITIDGAEEIHNKRRVLPNANGYQLIIKNITQVCDLMDICVRINVDKNNKNDLDKLLLEMQKNETIKQNVYFYLGRVIGEKQKCMNKIEFNDTVFSFLSTLKKYDFNVTLSNLSLHGNLIPCVAMSENSFVIDADGKLYKCYKIIGDADYCVGQVGKVTEENRIEEAFKIDAECKQCNILPFCMRFCCPMDDRGLMRYSGCKEEKENQLIQMIRMIQ